MLKKYGLTLDDLHQLYFNGENITKSNERKLLELWGDINFVEPIHRLEKIQYHNSAAPTYLYKVTYDKNVTVSKKMHSNIEGLYNLLQLF